MSKIIRMTPEYIEECRKDFEESLKNAKLADGKLYQNICCRKEKGDAVFHRRSMGEDGYAAQ